MNAPESRHPAEPPLAIVLVHGYLGAPGDLAPLTDALAAREADAAIERVCLPGHGAGLPAAFDEATFLEAIASAIDRHPEHDLILIGHSTGGSLLLAELARRRDRGDACLQRLRLLVLCATPPRIDLGYAERWSRHTEGLDTRLHDIGALVSLVNRPRRRGPLPLPAPVLIVHGDADELVPVEAVPAWAERLAAPQRRALIRDARHHLFAGNGAALAIDAIVRAVADARRRPAPGHAVPASLFDLVPGLEPFCAQWPDSAVHLGASPAAHEATGRRFPPSPVAVAEPTIANIEITTRCNLGCPACARTRLKRKSHHMRRQDFERVLAQLPHAYRVVLVGLGETLMHPEVLDFIDLAAAQGRRVGLVTNASLLDADTARALCASRLSSITFSLDAVDQVTADRVRTGSDMAQILANIRGFMAVNSGQGARIGTSVFTALSADTVAHFEAVVDVVADLGIDALMVTDLNFPANQSRSVHRAFAPEHGVALRRALKKAVARRLPVLSVLGLETFALEARYLDYLLLRGEQLAARSATHRHCWSPWQSIPVNVDGNLTCCDCQPDTVIGNIHRDPVSAWWNGPAMVDQRQRMLSETPPEACLVCPRF